MERASDEVDHAGGVKLRETAVPATVSYTNQQLARGKNNDWPQLAVLNAVLSLCWKKK